MSWFKKLVNNLFNENDEENLASDLEETSANKQHENKEESTYIDEEYLFELEEHLLTSDFGMEFAEEVINKIRSKGSITIAEAKQELKNICESLIERVEQENTIYTYKGLQIIIVIGVNGVGKTTSIGKLANQLQHKGKKVLIAPCDTFRAAALEQLIAWTERAGATFFKSVQAKKADAILFEAMQKASIENYDVLIVDTAGRLQNKKDLMLELEKLSKVIDKHASENIKIERLLVLDATTGQNALKQASLFNEVAKITGIILTKFDGSSKGGIVFSVIQKINAPIKFLGIGEGLNDLEEFSFSKLQKQFI